MHRGCSRYVAVRLLEALSSALGVIVLWPGESAFAACDSTAPLSGQTVTCTTSVPNPFTTPVAATPGSTNVTVNVAAGAELDVTNNNVILVRDGSTVINLGTLRGAGDTFDAVSAHSGGAGQNVLINRGAIFTSGVESEGIFNNGAAVTMLNDTTGVIRTTGNESAAMHDFQSPGGGTLTNYGTLSTSGDNSPGMAALAKNDTLVNNGSIVTTGTSSYWMPANGNAVSSNGNNVLTNHGTIDLYGAYGHGLVSFDSAPGVVTNTGSITGHGANGLGALLSGKIILNNAAGASIVSQQANAIVANGAAPLPMRARLPARSTPSPLPMRAQPSSTAARSPRRRARQSAPSDRSTSTSTTPAPSPVATAAQSGPIMATTPSTGAAAPSPASSGSARATTQPTSPASPTRISRACRASMAGPTMTCSTSTIRRRAGWVALSTGRRSTSPTAAS